MKARLLGAVLTCVTVAACGGDSGRQAGVAPTPVSESNVVQCAAQTTPINPLIYGIGFRGWENQDQPEQWTIGATSRRWGGNPTSRYNWRSGHFWNTANDYYFLNINILAGDEPAHEQFLRTSSDNGMSALISIPMLGWVAKDDSSYSFPVSQFGEQESTEYSITDAGNGRDVSGTPLTPGPPETTSIRSTSTDATEWVASLVAYADSTNIARPAIYFLDNEPDLWHYTHRDVRTTPVGYDELVQLGVEYADAILEADPDAVIAGPSPWGWPTYFDSTLELDDGVADRAEHGGVPILEWYLSEMASAEMEGGVRLLDLLDIHFYPQGDRIYLGGGTDAQDPDLAERRVRSTRGLWDSTYVDESWIKEPVRLIPRMQELIDSVYPGTGLSIGEYNFGGETEISGGIALAEALGRFGQLGVDAASLWTYPPLDSPAYWAFRAFRNYDGNGAQFLDRAVPTSSADSDLSIFAAVDSDDPEATTLILINTSSSRRVGASIDVGQCDGLTDGAEVKVHTDGGAGGGVQPEGSTTVTNGSITVDLAPWSITVLSSPSAS